ncbi:Oidioi.mRNA.OKI2018_I69.PAR.g8603.t1.cds [Oikopleura dioica]|uniref:Oidioi.mRNA.OKI2018_I69.PAR.g8603.t1.cds n=1 Tax=Oikopleura dioica TaxID=34765 RepID=A0ABN7RGN8_OIKDI|nr:Oidioi.mRNA.OKI2018_I69.PAR.g8603.t1.cds [Oikopleura dioica]
MKRTMKSFQNTGFAALLIFCISFLFLGSLFIPKNEKDENFQVMIEEIWEDQNEILSILTEENFYQKQKERQAKIIREENQEENEQAYCELNIQPSIEKKIEPKYNLSPERFLTAFVSRGPNNQIYSLRETIFIALALNRTLILPPFFKHDRGDPTSNGSNTAVVDFDQRVDIEKLRELIPGTDF